MTITIPISDWIGWLSIANREELMEALTIAKRNAHDFAIAGSDRVLWRDMVSLLNKQLKRFD